MSEIVIKVENLSKKYIIGHNQEGKRYIALRDVISEGTKSFVKGIFNPSGGNGKTPYEEFWALRNINFEVKQSERIGVIGRNGAGKSTLLKLLSRITEPTEGRINLKGRVASLLEVGTGFHPELTGRENIYLNGAILGMSKFEIKKKFNEIVDFAEIEKFLDTPVKRYSSGMYVRLAFAVAAHLEPEILLVDEVLAVGDAQFQKKCLGKMEDVSKEGRTILFVSHNMTAIKILCNSGIFLQNGTINFIGNIDKVVDNYLNDLSDLGKISVSERKRDKKYSLRAKILEVKLFAEEREEQACIDSTKPFKIELIVEAYDKMKTAFNILIRDNNQVLLNLDSGHIQNKIYLLNKGINKIFCEISPTYLTSGDYIIDCALLIPNQEWIDFIPYACTFTVRELDPYGTGFNLKQDNAKYHVNYTWSEPILIE